MSSRMPCYSPAASTFPAQFVQLGTSSELLMIGGISPEITEAADCPGGQSSDADMQLLCMLAVSDPPQGEVLHWTPSKASCIGADRRYQLGMVHNKL